MFENMFDDIGGKIKKLAKIMTYIGFAISILLGLLAIEEAVGLALFIIVIGCVASWVGSFLLYGFGELIDYTKEIADNTKKTQENQTENKE